MKYRADVDGLRAIAIILVLMYHGGFALFPSGFVGVDVFFVISGFLITSIIHNSLHQNNFSFIDFYNRRLWRLQPVLISLLCFTSLACLIFFLPEDLTQFSRSARKTSLFISNVFFNQNTTGYFASDSHQLPLLHTWSLSIEWQCYFLLPAFMYFIHKIVNEQKTVICCIFFLTIISFLLTLHWSYVTPAESYFQFSSRVFEFLIGACAALLQLPNLKIHKYTSTILAAAALIVIFYAASRENILLGYPNSYALLVCLATALLIILGTKYASNKVIQLLSSKPLVFIGLLSYSLYIWHWAIFSLLRYQNVPETWSVISIAYILIFVIAYCSWRFIEQPSKKFKNTKFAYSVCYLLLVPIAVVHLSDYIIKMNQGFPQRFDAELVQIYHHLDEYASDKRPQCISNKLTDADTRCQIGASKASQKGLMIGDSFANHYWGFIDTLATAANLSVVTQGVSSCITLPGIYLYDWWHFKNQIYQECYAETQRYYQMISANHYNYVLLGQNWSNYLSENVINELGDARSISLTKKRIKVALNEALKTIVASGAKPVIIKTSALMQEKSSDCFFKHIKLHKKYDSSECRFEVVSSTKDLWFEQLFAAMQERYPQLILIDPKKVQCLNNQCSADIKGIPVYRDVGHLTDYASYKLGQIYLQKFKNPLTTG